MLKRLQERDDPEDGYVFPKKQQKVLSLQKLQLQLHLYQAQRREQRSCPCQLQRPARHILEERRKEEEEVEDQEKDLLLWKDLLEEMEALMW